MAEHKKVAILMGSGNDAPTMKPAFSALEELGIPFEGHIMSAHRTPEQAAKFASSAHDNGFGVIIAAAGKAAHLAGVIAAHTTLPVVGVPLGVGGLGGLDALLATVQMPSGIPVATVAVDGAKNAAILAAQILAVSDGLLADKLARLKRSMTEDVLKQDEAFTAGGWAQRD